MLKKNTKKCYEWEKLKRADHYTKFERSYLELVQNKVCFIDFLSNLSVIFPECLPQSLNNVSSFIYSMYIANTVFNSKSFHFIEFKLFSITFLTLSCDPKFDQGNQHW